MWQQAAGPGNDLDQFTVRQGFGAHFGAMPIALSLAAQQARQLSPEAVRRVLVYTCALALIGAGMFAPAAAASTVCLANKAFMASL